MKKRILSIALAMIIALSMVPSVAFAEYDYGASTIASFNEFPTDNDLIVARSLGFGSKEFNKFSNETFIEITDFSKKITSGIDNDYKKATDCRA